MSISLQKEQPSNLAQNQRPSSFKWPPLAKDKLFDSRDKELIWKKYCGFMDLSLDEFMIMQKLLLMEQIELIISSQLGHRLIGHNKPRDIDEFRKCVPLTRYEDYQPTLGEKDEQVLNFKPAIWAHTSGRTGFTKWVPYSIYTLGALADDTWAAMILSSASKRGEVLIEEGCRVVLNLPPMPYTTGIMGHVANERLPYQAIPPLDEAEQMEFEERIEKGFKMALYTGIDYVASMAVVLAKLGDSFGKMGRKSRLIPTWHPAAIYRLLKAVAISKLKGRPILPKDLWKVKGLLCGGSDSSLYRDQIYHSWGVQPLDIYVCTEACFIAMQNWNKKGMTFIPYRNFYEFIPEDEWRKNRDDNNYQPSTVLINELEEGKIYELVITNFHGGPFIRYRLGDLIKIVSLKDAETGVKLPQMVFYSWGGDDIIEIAGFPRLDEKAISQAIKDSGVAYVDWVARKEKKNGKPSVHIYIELQHDGTDESEIEKLLDQRLMAMDHDYKDLRSWITEEVLQVSILRSGSFAAYKRGKQASGAKLYELKPPRVNASDDTLNDLLSLQPIS